MEQKKRTVIIKSRTDLESVLGVHEFRHETSGKKLGKRKIGRSKDKLTVGYSRSTGKMKTGLNKPWLENGKQKVDKVTGKPLLLQHYMEQRWNLPHDYLTDRGPRRGDSGKRESDLPYYFTKTWSLEDGETVFNLDNMDEELGYHAMLEHKKVANSRKELLAHKWPYATHYIAEKNEDENQKHAKYEYKAKAFAALNDKNMTYPIKDTIVKVLTLRSTMSTPTKQVVDNLLYEYIDNSTMTEGSNIDKFMELSALLAEATGREELQARFLLQQALDARVMYEKSGSYNWPRSKGAISIGDNYREAIDFLVSPGKSTFVEELEDAIKAKIA